MPLLRELQAFVKPLFTEEGRIFLEKTKFINEPSDFKKLFEDNAKESLIFSEMLLENAKKFEFLKKQQPLLLEILEQSSYIEKYDYNKKFFIKRFLLYDDNKLRKTRTITAVSLLAFAWFSRNTIKRMFVRN